MAPPIISFKSTSVVSEIEEACSTSGAFVLVDHPLDTLLLQKVLTIGHEFFQLPMATKERCNLQRFGSKWRGHMPLGGESPVQDQFTNQTEGLYMGDEHAHDHPNLGLPTFGTNVFPDDELLEMRPVFEEYLSQMKELGNQMMRLLSMALDLPDEHYLETHVTKHDPIILPRMFHYLPQQHTDGQHEDAHDDDDVHRHWGIGRHSDYGLLTMILTDAPGSLEFQDVESGDWHAVPFVPHSIIMNVGHVLDRLSNGRFVAANHRARYASSTEPRLCLPFFYNPSWTARMKTLPCRVGGNDDSMEVSDKVKARWSVTRITCDFDGSVEYSEFLAKEVAKVFPDLVPESVWKNHHALVVSSSASSSSSGSDTAAVLEHVMNATKRFYEKHATRIKRSHGWESHVSVVYNHAAKAIACHEPPLSATQALEVKIAAILHDVDDSKYFPNNADHENALGIMKESNVPTDMHDGVLEMVDLVSCSTNGNHVPLTIIESGDYYKLISRWSDRLEAVGSVGVVRCYQYNQEKGRPFASPQSPRAQTAGDVWKYATQDRFEAYQARGGTSTDMISHYYDKLLHVACPPRELIRNSYLECMAEESASELVEVCIRFGKTGAVDEEYIQQVARELSLEKE